MQVKTVDLPEVIQQNDFEIFMNMATHSVSCLYWEKGVNQHWSPCEELIMKVYQFYSGLEDYKPKIWRRFYVNKNITLAKLAYTIMTMYEMRASHLFAIEYEKEPPSGEQREMPELIGRYGIPSEDSDYDGHKSEDATKTKLASLDLGEPYRLVVNYDFGDDWRVIVRFEKEVEVADLGARDLPRVIAGEGFGILEDCGGVYGLMDLAPAIKNKGAEYEEYRAETGVKNLDLDKCDLDDINFRLKKLPAIFAKIYEKHTYPSRQSINFIERKYLK